MGFSDWLLALHVLAAFAWIASLVVFTVVIVAGRRLTVPSDVVRLFWVSRAGDVLISIGMVGTLVFGIWLAIDLDAYHPWDGWIIAAVILWFVAGEVGRRTGAIYDATRARAKELVREGNDAPSPELSAMLRTQRGATLHGLLVLVTLVFLVVMIYKPGA
jgi:hypothetical protein